VPFYFIESGDLSLIHTDADGTETELVLDVDYSVTGAGDPTGTVTTTIAYPSGGTITVLRDVQPLQTHDFTDGDDFPAATVEIGLDRLTQLVQQALEIVGRALVFSPSDADGSTLPAAASRANLLLGFDSDGRVSLVAPVSGSAAALALDLANTASATKGPALVGFAYAMAYASGTVGYALKQHRIDVRLLGVDNTGATDCSTALAAALALGIPLAMRGTFKLLSKVTYTGAVDILGEDCTINSDVTCFEITDGDGSRIRNLNLMPITTPYTLLRNTTTWVNVAGDVVQSLEGYQPSALDTDIWASLSGAIQNQSANKTINPGIIFKSSTGLTARRDVQISGITGRAVLIQLEGYSDSEVSGCDFGAGPREGINFLNGQTLARGARNRIINNRVRYASQCGILWWAQDELECYGNDSRLNGESNYKSYQYDGTNTTDVISKRCRIFGNHSQDAFYDGFDLQSYYNVADPGVYTANQCYGNTSRNCRHTTFTINGEGDTMSLNYAERSGSHGISVKSKRATVTGNSTKDCCAFPAVHAFQIFDMLVQGDGINSSSNNIANATAAYTYNYLHSGVTGADPTTGDEGFDFGNRCSGGPDRITVSKNIPTYLITSVVKSITAATYTVAGTDAALSFFTSATCTVTLPSPAAYPGRVLSFRNTAAFAINSASANVSPIGGGALSASILAATVGKWCELQSDGTNWLIMSSN
jgi:hypothetical protein